MSHNQISVENAFKKIYADVRACLAKIVDQRILEHQPTLTYKNTNIASVGNYNLSNCTQLCNCVNLQASKCLSFQFGNFIHCIVKNLSSDLFVKRKVIAETKYHTIIARENNIWNR